MILYLGQSILPMERPSFSSRSKIRQEAENLHRGAEIRRTEKANYHFRQPTLAPRPLESVFATGLSVLLKFTKVPYLIDSRNTDATWLRGIGFDNGCTMSLYGISGVMICLVETLA